MTKAQKSARATSPKRRLGFGWFIAAVIFLFNPCINIFDLLPDFFGIFFLMKGLEKWADLCPNMRDAVTGLIKLRYFMLAKLFAILLIPLLPPSEGPTFKLLLTFVFAIVELVYIIPAAGRIFDGFEYFGTRFDGKYVFSGIKNVRTFTNVFFILKSAFCVLPELCSLSSFQYSGYITNGVQFDIARYQGFLNSFNLTVGTTLGFIWLVVVLTYIIRIANDKPFLVRILHDYEIQIGQDIGLAIRRNLRTSLTLIIVGVAFLPNIWIDDVNVIPTFIGTIFIWAAMANIRQMAPIPKSSLIFPALFTLFSALSYGVSLYFDLNFELDKVYEYAQVYNVFNITRIAAAFEYTAMGVVVYIIFRELRRISETHLVASGINDRTLVSIYDKHKHESDVRITAWIVLGMITTFSNAAYILLRADVKEVYWYIPLVITLIFIAYTAAALGHIYDRIKYKYI